jgi:ribosomal protein L11 methylase PrmA
MYFFVLTLLFLFIFLIFLFTAFLLIHLILNLVVFFGAPFVPTPQREIKRILKLANLKPGETLYDLGSGDGRIIIEAVKNYPVKAVGIEIDPILVYFSRRQIKKLGLQERVKVLWGNFFKKDLSPANVIVVYLSQPTNNRLERKFLSELKPKTQIISRTFTFKNLPLIKSDPEKPNIRLYQIPEHNSTS